MAEQQEIFAADELEAIAKALGDTSEGLTGSEIRHILQLAQLCDVDPAATKWKRIHNAFVDYQNRKRSRTAILAFIRKAMKPTRYRGKQDHFETMRHNLNGALSFCGLSVQEDGELISVKKAKTLTEFCRRIGWFKPDGGLKDMMARVYKASGWTLVGTTKGRGRYDRHTRRDQPKKDIWLRPLRKDWRRTLNR